MEKHPQSNSKQPSTALSECLKSLEGVPPIEFTGTVKPSINTATVDIPDITAHLPNPELRVELYEVILDRVLKHINPIFSDMYRNGKGLYYTGKMSVVNSELCLELSFPTQPGNIEAL